MEKHYMMMNVENAYRRRSEEYTANVSRSGLVLHRKFPRLQPRSALGTDIPSAAGKRPGILRHSTQAERAICLAVSQFIGNTNTVLIDMF